MRFTIERLRAVVLVLAGLLVIGVVGFLGYARYRAGNILRDLPHKLGIQIQQSADGYTLSQSKGSHTLFTLHASKVIQYKDKGRATLHDVSILLYGADGKRADRISGQDFDYDPSNEIVQAQGEVQIDLQSPVRSAATGTANGEPAAATEEGSIRVKTSGLAFNQKTGMATTNENLEFQFPQASGKATGASYDSQRGVLILDHAVEISSAENGNALLVHAAHAQFVRDSHRGFLENIACIYRGDHMSADHATLLFRDDGSAQQIEADGHIHLQTDAGGVIDSKAGVMQMDQRSEPLKAELSGGVAFHSYDAQHKINGNSGEGSIVFGEKGSLRHATLSNLVSVVEVQTGLPNDPGGTATRQVQSGRLDIDFNSGKDQGGKNQRLGLKAVLAQGDAKVALRTSPGGNSALVAKAGAKPAANQDTAISADRLLATFADGSTITTLDGTGHTRLAEIASDATAHSSTGDTLAVKFVPVEKIARGQSAALKSSLRATSSTAARLTTPSSGMAEIQSVVQQGNVVVLQAAVRSTAPASAEAAAGTAGIRGTAQKATYTAASQMLHLEGAPRVTDGPLNLTAATIDYSRATGDATANGGVKATYMQPSGGEIGGQLGGYNAEQAREQRAKIAAEQGILSGSGPAHIVAAQATLLHASGDAVFRGQARLWQGTNSIAAPVIELSRAHGTLKAHGDGPQLSGSGGANVGSVNAALLTSTGASRQPGMAHVKSEQLLYSDGERKATFRGGVIADDGTATIRSDEAEVFLVQPATRQLSPAAGKQVIAARKDDPASSRVDHMIANGHVALQQPGRKATGEKLIYSAQDGTFVLTGAGSVRPTLTDAAHGKLTGDSLIFNSRDDSVTVSGGASGTATQTRSPR